MAIALRLIFLFFNAAVLPMTTWYLVQARALESLPPSMITFAFWFVLPMWTIIFLGMGVAKFPAETWRGAIMLIGLVGQFIIFLVSTDYQWGYSFFTLFIASFVGTTLFLASQFLYLSFPARKGNWWLVAGIIAAIGAAGWFIVKVASPVFHTISQIETSAGRILAIIVFVASILSTTVGLFRLRNDKSTDTQDKLWERLAGVTAMTIVLTTCVSFVIAVMA